MTGSHVGTLAVCPIELGEHFGQIILWDGGFASTNRTGVLRELPGGSVNPVLFEEIPSIRHHGCRCCG